MAKPIFVLNGPNLNRLGTREPEIYGTTTLAEIERMCREAAADHPVRFHQSNAEHQLIDWIHEAADGGAGIIINAAAYTFTSLAILDALKMVQGPIIELHISNIHRREAHYQHSLISKTATAVIVGLGAKGYPLAVTAMLALIRGNRSAWRRGRSGGRQHMHGTFGDQVPRPVPVGGHMRCGGMRFERRHAFPFLDHHKGVRTEGRLRAGNVDDGPVLDAAGLGMHCRHDGLEGLEQRGALAGLGGDDGKNMDH